MPFRIAYDTDYENPNRHAWEATGSDFATEAEAWNAADEELADFVDIEGHTLAEACPYTVVEV